MKKRPRYFLWGALALFCYALIAIVVPPKDSWPGHDGLFFESSADLLFQYASSPLDLFVIDPVAGMGGEIQPMGVWLHPGFLPLYLFDQYIEPRMIACLVVMTLIALTTYRLARGFNVSVPLSVFAAQLVAIASLPPFFEWHSWWFGITKHNIIMGPFAAVPGVLAVFFLASFLRVGKGSRAATILGIAMLPLIPIYSILCEPLYTTTIFAPFALLSCGVMLGSKSRKMFLLRGVALLACAAVMYLCGAHTFFSALAGTSARLQFSSEICSNIQRFDLATEFIFYSKYSAAAMTMVIGACFITAIAGRRQQRAFCWAVLLVIAGLIVISLVYVYGNIHWLIPYPSYFEHGMIAPYFVSLLIGSRIAYLKLRATALGRDAERWLSQRRPAWFRISPKMSGYALVFIVPVCSLVKIDALFADWPRIINQQLHPSGEGTFAKSFKAESPLAELLTEELSLRGEGEFHGSLARILFVPGGPLADYENLGPAENPAGEPTVNARTKYMEEFIPNLWTGGLIDSRIPRLDDFKQLLSPPYYYLFSRALRRPQDYQPNNFVTISRFDGKLLAGLGARFLLTDLQLHHPSLTLRSSQKVGPDYAIRFEPDSDQLITLFLYELENPNVGDHSPTQVLLAENAKEALQLMTSDDFVFREQVVLFDSPGPLQLIPASKSKMFFQRGGVRVKATSAGQSMIVLPLQFSHVLSIESNQSASTSPAPRLLRANLAQTAVLFSGEIDIKISNDFGFFRNDGGRHRDIEDYHRLGFVETGEVPYPPHYNPHSLFK